MVFNSIEFLIFGLLFFLLWPVARKKDNPRWIFIVVASFLFYGWWDWRFLFLIIFSGLVDYFSGIYLKKKPQFRKLTLGFSLLANLGSLAIFKYSKFIGRICEDLFNVVGIQLNLVENIPEFALILPVGISFYTFQSLSYTIDIYRNRLEPTKNIFHFFAYLSMFPQLVAGPIVRAKDFLFQLSYYRIPSAIEKWNALKLILFGLFQKMVIADNLSYLIDSAYEGKSMYSGTLFWWVVAIAFSFQIYSDFAGYTNIARGLAKYMGYHFKMNFNHPYLSKSLREFWTKWHISLSTWFRDYVYIPLGGSRRGVYMGYFALLSTMMLSGIWHGANYTFIVWAGIHSVFLILDRVFKYSRRLKHLPLLLILIVFIQATLAWVYFRAPSIGAANKVITNLITYSKTEIGFVYYYFDNLLFLSIAMGIELIIYLRKKGTFISSLYSKNKENIDVVLMALCIILIIFFRGDGKQFIYFQF